MSLFGRSSYEPSPASTDRFSLYYAMLTALCNRFGIDTGGTLPAGKTHFYLVPIIKEAHDRIDALEREIAELRALIQRD